MLFTQSVNWYWCHNTAQPKNNDDDNLGLALYLTQATVPSNSNSHPAAFFPFSIHWCPPKSNPLNVDLIMFPYFIYHPSLTLPLSLQVLSGHLRHFLVPGSTRRNQAVFKGIRILRPARIHASFPALICHPLISPVLCSRSWLPSPDFPGL